MVIGIAAIALGATWSGIRPEAVPVVHDAVFATPDDGWTASVDGGGKVRVLVAHDDATARAWLHDRVGERTSVPPAYPFAEEAYGNGIGYLLFRDGNVAATVEVSGTDALDVASRLEGALEPATTWPASPALSYDGHEAALGGSWARVAFRAMGPLDPVTLLPATPSVVPSGPGRALVTGPVTRIVATAWDPYGRAVEASWVAAVGAPR